VKIEVRQREREDQGLRREGETPRTDLESSYLPAQLFTSSGVRAASAVSALPMMVRKSANGTGPTSAGGAKMPVFAASSPTRHGAKPLRFENKIAPCRRRGALPRSRRDQCPCPRNEGPHDQGSLRRPVRFAGRSARSGRRVLLPSTFHLSRRLAFPIFSLRQKTLVRSLSALLAPPLRRSCHGGRYPLHPVGLCGRDVGRDWGVGA
jgi:hypothetical protein